MFSLAVIPQYISKGAKATKLFCITHKSEIVLTGGIVSFIGSEVLACRHTLKTSKLLDEMDKEIVELKSSEQYTETLEDGTVIVKDEKALNDEIRKVKAKFRWQIARGYIPPLILMVGGIAGCTASHVILNRELAAQSAAAAGIAEAYNAYRSRVIADQGKEKDIQYLSGGEMVEVVDEATGEKSYICKIDDSVAEHPTECSTVRLFGEGTSKYWTESCAKNHARIREVLIVANDQLTSNGYIFFDDVLNMLGMTPGLADHYTGWVKNRASDIITFGFEDPDDVNMAQFMNGYEPNVWLTFNVQGDIRYVLENPKKDTMGNEIYGGYRK